MKTQDHEMSESSAKGCACIDLLQSVVDGQASQEQITYFHQHMLHCAQCATTYRVDTVVQTLVKTNCCGGQPPEDLAEKIKDQIRKLS
ncbi:MAG: hypothetical protein ACO263_03425 [Cyclobacteriaceae bacterium]|jgi:mycothiol system anti-sigma-R factor